MNASVIRRINTSRVFHALRRQPGMSQRELATTTGIDRATISAVISGLEQQGLVERTPIRGRGRAGRPEQALLIPEQAGTFLGARLEPTTIRTIATTLDGKVLKTHQAPGSRTVAKAIRYLQQAIDQVLGELPAHAGVKGIGIGVPGIMDSRGHLALAPNLGWRNVAIRERLEQAFDFPVFVDNDTKAAALAEQLFGACQARNDFVFITGHSGVGGGLYLGGALYRGFRGYAGEIGHTKIVPEGRACACGGRGCLEAYVSEASILRRLEEAGEDYPDVWDVARAAEQGHPVVRRILEETGNHLGLAIANLINLLNPELVVLGGNLAVVSPYAMPAIQRVLRENALDALTPDVDIIISPLGPESVPMGGVALAMEGVLSLPSWLAKGAFSNHAR